MSFNFTSQHVADYHQLGFAIFRDLIPPALQSLKDGGWLADKALLVVESDAGETFETPGYTLLDERDYGETRLRFLTST